MALIVYNILNGCLKTFKCRKHVNAESIQMMVERLLEDPNYVWRFDDKILINNYRFVSSVQVSLDILLYVDTFKRTKCRRSRRSIVLHTDKYIILLKNTYFFLSEQTYHNHIYYVANICVGVTRP